MPLPTGPIGPFPAGADPETYDHLRRRVLWSMPTGLYLVGSRAGDTANLMTCSLVVQVATAPKLVAAAIERDSVTLGLVRAGGWFSVCLLDRADRALVRRFAKPATDVTLDDAGALATLHGEPVREVAGGVPVLAASLAWLACEVRHTVLDDGATSHVLVVGEVADAGEAPPPAPDDDDRTGEVLGMGDTRMSYGG